MQHLSRVGGGNRLRARVPLMRCTPPLGFVEDAIPRVSAAQAHSHTRSRARIRLYMRCAERWIYNSFFNRFVGSADRLTRRRREPYVPESPQLSSASPEGPPPQPER